MGMAVLARILGDERGTVHSQVMLAKQHMVLLKDQLCKTEEGATTLRSFLHHACTFRKKVDQANDITKLVRPLDGIVFEMIAHAPVLCSGYGEACIPELGVRIV